MSLKILPIPTIPEETARIVRACFPHGTLVVQLRDALGALYRDEDFADLFPTRGQPAEAPWRLALVTVLQSVEGLPDRQAADAVRSRLDWKYALSLELTDPGFDHTVLSEFRMRLVAGGTEERLLDLVLAQARDRGWLKVRGKQRTDSTQVLAAVRALTRLEAVGETLRHTLNVLAEVAPEWLRARAQPEWLERYAHRIEEYRLPSSKAEREQYGNAIGAAGWRLLAVLDEAAAPAWLPELPAVQTLRRVWAQQFHPRETSGQAGGSGAGGGSRPGQGRSGRWRHKDDLPPADQVQNSPYGPTTPTRATARSARRAGWATSCMSPRAVRRTDRVSLSTSRPRPPASPTRPCSRPATPTWPSVASSPAWPPPQRGLLPSVASSPAWPPPQRGLLPSRQLVDAGYVDAGYVDAEALATNQARFGVEVLGPTRGNWRWQARETTGFARHQFAIDWEAQRASCPQGYASRTWRRSYDHRRAPPRELLTVTFSPTDCRPCPTRMLCTHPSRRTITLHPREHAEALPAARAREQTDDFAAAYALRAGVEGTHAQALRVCGGRRSRYLGQAKTHLQHILSAVALNLLRIGAWLNGTPLAPTRQSAFARLMASAA